MRELEPEKLGLDIGGGACASHIVNHRREYSYAMNKQVVVKTRLKIPRTTLKLPRLWRMFQLLEKVRGTSDSIIRRTLRGM